MKKSEKTQKLILENAIKIFYQKGYDGTTTKEIANESKISEGTIFKYFNSKKELLTKCIYQFIDDFSNEILFLPLEEILLSNKDSSFEVILKKIIYDRKKLFDKYFKQIAVLITESKNHPEIKEILVSQILPKFNELSNKLFAIGVNKGEIRNDLNSTVIIRTFISSVFAMLINREFLKEIETNLTIDQEIDSLIEIFFNGIKRR